MRVDDFHAECRTDFATVGEGEVDDIVGDLGIYEVDGSEDEIIL